MSDKNLTEAEWKKFAKGRDLKDAGLLKALGAYEKAKGPEEVLKALAAVEKEADALRKFVKGDKDFGAQLDGIDKAIAKEEKQAKAEQKEAESQQQSESEEEESPALLTSKMVPLLRQVRKGEVMQVLIANAGKEVAVLLSRRAISPTRRKLLQEYLQASTVKPITGTCVFEENAYTFVVQSQAGGLAKKLKAALLAQVELRLKVRVRGEDGELDDDGEPAEDEEGGSETETQEEVRSQGIPEAPPQKTDTVEEPSKDPLQAEFDKRWAAVERQLLDALRANAGDTSKLRAVGEFVREKGETGAYKAALQGMDTLQKLLGVPPAPPLPPTTKPEEPKPGEQTSGEKKPEPDGEAQAFNQRLAALLPKVKQALAVDGDKGRATDAKLKASEAGVYARKKEFDTAHRLLDEAEEMADWIIAHPDGEPDSEQGGEQPEREGQDEQAGEQGSADQQRYEKLLAQFEPAYLDLLAERHPEASKLRTVMAYAAEQAEAGDYAKAWGALDRLGKLIEAAQAAPVARGGDEPAPGIVAYRKSLLALRQAVATVDRQIAQLVGAIPGQLPDELELAEDLAEDIRESTEAINDLVDTAMSALGDAAEPATQALRDQLDEFIAEVGESALIKHVDANPFGVKVSVEKTLGEALAAVRQAMPALS